MLCLHSITPRTATKISTLRDMFKTLYINQSGILKKKYLINLQEVRKNKTEKFKQRKQTENK